MKTFKEFQFGWMVVIMLVVVLFMITYFFIYQIGDRPIPSIPYFIIATVNLVILAMFYGMTTEVDDEKITVRFGVGLIRKQIDLKKIKQVEIVKNPWYYGWGIRFIPGGMLYNMSGLKGVELTFIDSKRIIRIGSKVTENLKSEIERRLTK